VNPYSGKKRALMVSSAVLQPLLEEAGLPYEIFITQRPNHSREFIAQDSPDLLDKYSALVIVSGDGLVFEVIQGLHERPDWEKAIQIPIGIVPGGTGNGLTRSLAYYNCETYENEGQLQSSLNIIKAKTMPMDLTKVTTSTGKTIHSFLSIGWGYFSDCDIGSEFLRFLVSTKQYFSLRS
jgi:sphingosine kinase